MTTDPVKLIKNFIDENKSTDALTAAEELADYLDQLQSEVKRLLDVSVMTHRILSILTGCASDGRNYIQMFIVLEEELKALRKLKK